MATSNNSVIISRIQNRRGLKQDLPQPLREGEIGLAVDSKQVYIGGSLTGNESKISILQGSSSSTQVESIGDSRIILFTVPHVKLFGQNGITKSFLWNITDNADSSKESIDPFYNLKIFNKNITSTPTALVHTANANVITSVGLTHELTSSNLFITAGDVVTGNDITGTVTVVSVDNTGSNTNITLSSNQSLTTANTLTFTPNNIKSIMTNEAFKASGLTVFKNNERLVGDDGNVNPSASKDYSFNSTTLGSNTHILNFRVAPLQSDILSVNYYGNNAITKAISNTSSIFVGTSTQSFYDQYNIPSYRKLSNSLIRVSETSGKGFIGLDYKHLAVYEDGLTISSPNSLSLGNLLVSENIHKTSSEVNVSQSGSIVTVNVGSSYNPDFSNTGIYDHIFFSDIDNNWINNKTMPVANVQSSTLEITLPSGNSWQIGRSVLASNSDSGVVTITCNVDVFGIEGLTNGDKVSFHGANVSNFSGIYSITNLTSSSFQVAEANITSEISSGLSIVNHGANTDIKNVQIISNDHGQPAYSNIEIYGSSDTGQINDTTFTIKNDTITTNTFFITATANITSNVSGFSNVLLTESTSNITPVRSYDLSSFTTLPAVVANISNSSGFLDMAYIPSFTNKVYVSTKPSNDSIVNDTEAVGLEFRLHNDSADTLGSLKLPAGNKLRSTHTVKAKLENWLDDVLVDKDVNIFTSVHVKEKFSIGTTNLGSFRYTVDTRESDLINFIEFDTREEAQAFNYIANNIYFKTADSEKQGLLNVETNIELLTSKTVGGGAKVTTFADTESAKISSSSGNINLSGTGATISTSEYDNFILEYSVNYNAGSQHFRRIGTMHLSLTSNNDVIFQDVASELADGVSGNVTFDAHYDSSNTQIQLSAVNSTTKELNMNYITRRWSS